MARTAHRRALSAVAVGVLTTAALFTAGPPAAAVNSTAATAASATSATSAVAAAVGAEAGRRGVLVSAEQVLSLTADEVRSVLGAQGYPTGEVRYGVVAHRLVHTTVDPLGRPTTASGLLVLPRGVDGPLPPVSYAHGTVIHRGDTPSARPTGRNAAVPLAFAAAGHAGVATDYLGLGSGPGTHPYLDIPSETSAQLDMLRAARTHAAALGQPLRREVLATGFSQGAPAALGLGRALQRGDDDYFRLGALAPVSGAYDLTGTEIPAILRGELQPKLAVFLVAYAYVALDRVHDVYPEPSAVFREPYASTVENYFDSHHTLAELAAATPDSVGELLTPQGLELLAAPTGGLAAGLKATDDVCRDWRPRVPVRLYLARGDEQAVNANSTRCQADFTAQGADSRIVDLGDVALGGSPHFGSEPAALADLLARPMRLR